MSNTYKHQWLIRMVLVLSIVLIEHIAFAEQPAHHTALTRLSGVQADARFIEADRAFANGTVK